MPRLQDRHGLPAAGHHMAQGLQLHLLSLHLVLRDGEDVDPPVARFATARLQLLIQLCDRAHKLDKGAAPRETKKSAWPKSGDGRGDGCPAAAVAGSSA